MSLRKLTALFLAAALFFMAVECVAKTKTAKAESNAVTESHAVSPAVISALAAGDLNGATLALREEKMAPKTLYLAREVTRLANFELQKKPDRSEAHKIYQNVAIDYHNLYLFLKTNGIEQKKFLEEALRYYRKARNFGTDSHKDDCKLLEAALYASSGDLKKAKKIFSKIDIGLLRGDFESMEYLAAYHASTGDVVGAVEALGEAYRLNPDATLTWLAVGDDFYAIRGDPEFERLLISLKVREAEKRLTLSLPKPSKPKLDVADDSGLFRPQKSMPHYVLKKKGKVSKKAAASSGKKGKKGAAKKTVKTKKAH